MDEPTEPTTKPEMPGPRGQRTGLQRFDLLDRDVQRVTKEIFGEGPTQGLRAIVLALDTKVDLLGQHLTNALIAGSKPDVPAWFWKSIGAATGLWIAVGILAGISKISELGAKLHILGLW